MPIKFQHYMGERCEKQASCQEVGCEHNGRCVKEKNFKCHCPAGWTGPFCNIGNYKHNFHCLYWINCEQKSFFINLFIFISLIGSVFTEVKSLL